MRKKAFVTGWPISHSKSPVLHGYWLEKYGIEGTYEPIAVEADKFENFLQEMKSGEFAGGNVTIPHKETAFRLIKKLDAAASAIGAVNTIWIEDGELHGGNTDSYGFSANLDNCQPEWRDGKKALILGAGGAARAVVHAIVEAGYSEIHIANRTLSRAHSLAVDFGAKCSAHSWVDAENLLFDMDLVVNTTSLGMNNSNSDGLPALSTLKKSCIVTDIVYTPLQTPFLLEATKHGLKTVDGLGMLLHQAVPGFEKWFGVRPGVTPELRQHVLGKS